MFIGVHPWFEFYWKSRPQGALDPMALSPCSGQQLAHPGHHLCGKQPDAAQHGFMGQGSVPELYLRSKRERPSSLAVWAIFQATVSGEPTHMAPLGPASCSKTSCP